MRSRDCTVSVLVAPAAFPAGVTAELGAQAIAQGWASIRPLDRIRLLPQADGGRGTVAVLQGAVPGSRAHEVTGVRGPTGGRRTGAWLELPHGTAVIELAGIGGVALMKRNDPIAASSQGLGELIAAALDFGIDRLVVAVGDSASTDAGLPALDSIGSRRPPVDGAVVLADTLIPLLGDRGAAATLGPTVGANPRQMALLETRLANAADRLGANTCIPGAGAGGGIAFGLHHWGASIEQGARFVAELTGLARAVASSDVALTGAGAGSAVTALVLDESDRAEVWARAVMGPAGRGAERSTTLASLVAAHPLAGPTQLLRAAGATAASDFTRGPG